MATDTRVYVTPLKGPTLTKVQEPVVTVPIEEAELEWLGDRIVLQGKSLHVMWLFRRRAKSFVEFARRHED